MTKEQMIEKLKNEMTINGIVNNRFDHSVSVAKKAVELAKIHKLDLDLDKVYCAGLLHDCTKLLDKNKQKEILNQLGILENDEIMKAPNVWHGFTGAWYAKKEYGINDLEILNAIKYHVMGRAQMSDLEIVIFVADFVCDNRVGEVFEKARLIALESLIEAMCYIIESQIAFVLENKCFLVSQTLETYKYYKENINATKNTN